MEETKKSNGRGILILGAVLIVVGIVSINGDLWFSLISVCIGGLCVWSVFWKGQLNRVKKAYRREVATGMPLSLDRLAAHLEMEPDEVKTCLETLSAKGEIPSLRFTTGDTSQSINRGNAQPFRDGEQVTNKREQQPYREVPVSPVPPSSREVASQVRRPEPAIVAVRCRSCGAMAQLRQGEVVECEHCGNTLTL
ncbi:hypothetical protein [Adlercreutzia sp.]|uniref:hypothetical protein n=1 Tax=Adlercreutzia sp. TaxID=1872387 RepID=UPI003A86B9E2